MVCFPFPPSLLMANQRKALAKMCETYQDDDERVQITQSREWGWEKNVILSPSSHRLQEEGERTRSYIIGLSTSLFIPRNGLFQKRSKMKRERAKKVPLFSFLIILFQRVTGCVGHKIVFGRRRRRRVREVISRDKFVPVLISAAVYIEWCERNRGRKLFLKLQGMVRREGNWSKRWTKRKRFELEAIKTVVWRSSETGEREAKEGQQTFQLLYFWA